jgi:tellurite resistance protein TerC
MGNFRYLKPSLIAILLFVGVKMLLVHTPYKVDTGVSLAVVVGILIIGVIASIFKPGTASPAPSAPKA